MKGSLVLTVLIALYAVQGNGAATVDPSAETPTTTGGLSTSDQNSTGSPSASAPSTTEGNSTLAPSSSVSTLTSNPTSDPTTSNSNATGGTSTTTLNSPSTPSTTEPISTGSTSASAPNTTEGNSTLAPSTSVSTLTSNPTSATGSPSTSESTSNSSAPTSNTTNLPSTTQEPLPCNVQPCKYGATCINLKRERVCQCPYGFFYGSLGCQPGKVFPGQLELTVPYNKTMQNTNSSAYQELYSNVTQFFNETFENYTDYKETIIVSVEQFPSTFTVLRIAETTADVKIINMFDASTNLTESKVTEIIENSMDVPFVKNFTSITRCVIYDCDINTTNCEEPKDASQFPACTCNKDLAKKSPEDKACLLCNDQCTSVNHKQCLYDERGVLSCSCQPDYESKNEKCEACSFGFSGKDCSDSSLAILVGVATACGAVIMVLTGVLIYKLLRANKEGSSETKSLLNSDGSSTGRVPENNYVTNIPPREKIFPRVQASNPAAVNKTVMHSQEGRARNFQEPGIANKAYIPEQDYDDDDNHWMEMSARKKF